MTPAPKRPRPVGRLGQLNKRTRLVRRSLGQWTAQPQTTRNSPITRYSLEELAWKEGL